MIVWAGLSLHDSEQFPAVLAIPAGLTGILIGGVFAWARSWPQRNLLIFLSGLALVGLWFQSAWLTVALIALAFTVIAVVNQRHPEVLDDNRTD
jgi:hypothetical protein